MELVVENKGLRSMSDIDYDKDEDEFILNELKNSAAPSSTAQSTAESSVASSPKISEEQKTFDNLSTDSKLSKLDSLVRKSQVYSNIIADNLLANVSEKKQSAASSKKRSRRAVAADSRQPKLLSGATLKDYQLDGLDFLVSLYENGLNGILADEMGLGKTIQSISLIAFLMEQGITGPFLVVVPLSTIGNWKNEFSKFAPKIDVLLYIGSKDARNDIRNKHLNSRNAGNFNVVLTSYEVSIRDHAVLRSIDWKFLIVDEGHRLKNSKCLLIQKLKELNVSNRLLITGTPLQNNLNELWSLLNFILPDIFHDLELFQQWFNFDELTNLKKDTNNEFENKLIELNIQKSLIENLHTILKPFILRRLKKDVLKGLPPKKEYIVYVSLTEKQKKLYQRTLDGKLYESLVGEYFKDYLGQAMNIPVDNTSPKKDSPRSALDMLMAGSRANSKNVVPRRTTRGSSKAVVLPKTSTRGQKNESGAVSLSFLDSEVDAFLEEKLKPKVLSSKRRKTSKKITLAEDDSDQEFDHYAQDSEIEEESVTIEELERRITDFKYISSLPLAEGKSFFLNNLFQKVSKDLRNRSLQNMLMQLRNICNSPYIYYEPFPTTAIIENSTNTIEDTFMKLLVQNSAKIQILSQLVNSLQKKGHKILIFSQFTKMLDLLSDWFHNQSISVCRLDGSSNQVERQETIDDFNTTNGPSIFLLSTRAGGLGINLTTADTVILFDSDWNPQIDLQAIDRAHRIGQTKPVKIFRFVVRDSIEEVLLLKSYSKIFLNKLIIQMNEHKTKSLNQIIDTDSSSLKESDELVNNLKSLIDLPKSFNHKFKKNKIQELENKLSNEELEELLDRSDECYSDNCEKKKFSNISVFETINNMEQ